MNIFEEKLNESEEPDLPIDPVQLYQTCSYKDGYGYLRGIQEEVLKEWHVNRNQRDVICKMNTGSGKTLTGLLMLYSKLVEKKLPCLYVCPDKQLTEQTFELAGYYGMPVCVFEKPGEFPSDFVNGKKILICNFSKLFNGKSIFIRRGIKLGAIILDDAHKCVDIARDQSTLRISREHPISKKLFQLFDPALKFQLPGTFYRLEAGDPQMCMKVPYWAWMDKNETVIDIINKYVVEIAKDLDNDEGIGFKWNFMADNLMAYDCYFSGSSMEITPVHVPYHMLPSFAEAKHRYILSATFEDGYDLIRDLGIEFSSIVNPIVPKDRKDIGKRLIMAPSRFDPMLSDDQLRKFIATYPKKGHNVVVLVPSSAKATNWKKLKATLVDKDNIDQAIAKLRTSKGNFMIFINRYDGIDLNGDLCRVLVLDGLPMYSSLLECYAETRVESLSSGKKAQIIEQGLGRAVRSGGDYCAVYLMGSDLTGFLGVEKNMDHFTPVTRSQLNLGLKLLDGRDKSNSLQIIESTISLCLTQDESWLKYHTKELAKISADSMDDKKRHRLEIAESERKALIEFRRRNYQPSGEVILKEIVNKNSITEKEKAWYYQMAAQFIYPGNVSLSNDLQSKAASITSNMLHPPQGHAYNKILKKGAQPSMIKKRLEEFERPEDIILYVNSLTDQLQYNPDLESKDFETKLAELGNFLGFSGQTPELDYGLGPDGLWGLPDGNFLILEAKSRRLLENEISKDNIEQLQQAELWFKDKYGADAHYLAVTLQPNNRKVKGVFIDQYHRVLDKEALDLMHKNLRGFAFALKDTHPKAHSEDGLAKLLDAYSLTPGKFRSSYLKVIK
jgi:replicative superfamily II helicase